MSSKKGNFAGKYEDGREGEFGGELGKAETAGGGTNDFVEDVEGSEKDTFGEVEEVAEMVTVAGSEELVLRVP